MTTSPWRGPAIILERLALHLPHHHHHPPRTCLRAPARLSRPRVTTCLFFLAPALPSCLGGGVVPAPEWVPAAVRDGTAFRPLARRLHGMTATRACSPAGAARAAVHRRWTATVSMPLPPPLSFGWPAAVAFGHQPFRSGRLLLSCPPSRRVGGRGGGGRREGGVSRGGLGRWRRWRRPPRCPTLRSHSAPGALWVPSSPAGQPPRVGPPPRRLRVDLAVLVGFGAGPLGVARAGDTPGRWSRRCAHSLSHARRAGCGSPWRHFLLCSALDGGGFTGGTGWVGRPPPPPGPARRPSRARCGSFPAGSPSRVLAAVWRWCSLAGGGVRGWAGDGAVWVGVGRGCTVRSSAATALVVAGYRDRVARRGACGDFVSPLHLRSTLR